MLIKRFIWNNATQGNTIVVDKNWTHQNEWLLSDTMLLHTIEESLTKYHKIKIVCFLLCM